MITARAVSAHPTFTHSPAIASWGRARATGRPNVIDTAPLTTTEMAANTGDVGERSAEEGAEEEESGEEIGSTVELFMHGYPFYLNQMNVPSNWK